LNLPKHVLKHFVATAVILFCWFIPTFIRAEQNPIDSLKKELVKAMSTEKIKINYRLGAEFFDTLPDSAIYYYKEGLRLSREMKNDTFAAKCLNRIGILNFNAGDYEKAISNLYTALNIFERIGDSSRTVRCLQYLSMAYNEQGMYDKGEDFAKQSLNISRAIGDKSYVATGLANLGSIYYAQKHYDKALDYFQLALSTMEEIKDNQGIADALNNVALIYEEQKNLVRALEFHGRALALRKEIGDNRFIAASYHNIGLVYKGMFKYPAAIAYMDSSITLAKEGDDKFFLKESYNALAELYSNIGKFQLAYQTHLKFSALNDTLMNEENKRQFAEMNTKYETEKKDNQINLLNKDSQIREEQLRKQKIVRNSFMGGFAVVLLFASVFFNQRNKIKKGKQRSDELLLNILPEEVADELKEKGSAAAKQFDDVTVMFTDIKDFTSISETLSPTELVHEIHTCFTAFDDIIEKHNLEKIKTIGDAYMCAGGLPVVNTTHATDVVKAAMEIRDFMTQRNAHPDSSGQHPGFEIRIGIHTGPVVAGIVGTKKFAYDIWGDTVNIAARMESSGEAGKINISSSTFEVVKDKFICSYRGKIQAKNKGQIDMYFVD